MDAFSRDVTGKRIENDSDRKKQKQSDNNNNTPDTPSDTLTTYTQRGR